VQEVIADKEFRAGDFYHHKGAFPAAASRFEYLANQYPLYSAADQALWEQADSYRKMGDRFEREETTALTRIVRDYPLSAHVDEAKERLTALKQPIPQADANAYARQKYEYENRTKPSMFSKTMGIFEGRPDTHLAAKSGTPAMESVRPAVPVSVPAAAAGTQSGVSDVVGGVVGDSTNLDRSPDARMASQNGAVVAQGAGTGEQKASVDSSGQTSSAAAATPAAATPAVAAPPPTNHPVTAKQMKDYQKAQAKAQQKAAHDAKKKGAPAPVPAATTPGATTNGSAATPSATGTTAQPAAASSNPTPKQ
jgi:tetratricopeptide (TPR) repeat protein